ncbi:stalk domain-containing protein [Peptococcus simiae]|uniref:stalk domain-containing protein n=1 Tax=Peptococcus simiae TaxID=1643805 RepID=UPI0039805143
MIKKIIMPFFLGLLFCAAFNQPPAQAAITLLINNDAYFSEPRPELINSRVYVPLRTISEGLGYDVSWDQKEQLVSISRTTGNHAVSYNPSRPAIGIYIDGEKLALTPSLGQAYIKAPGYTMVPLRAISEGLGAQVEWHDGLVTVQQDRQRELVGEESQPEATWAPPTIAAEGRTADPPPAYEPIPSPASQAVQSGQTATSMTILGEAGLSLDQVNRYLAGKERQMQAQAQRTGKRFTPFPKNIGALYLSIAPKYGIRGDVALAQAIQETGYFQYGNEVLPKQNNYCGLGAIGRRTTQEDLDKQVFSTIDPSAAWLTLGVHGWSYKTPAVGVEAHLQHLYSYASANPLPGGCQLYDGRFNHGNRGKARVWADLNGRWAVPGDRYGQIIVEQIWREMASY